MKWCWSGAQGGEFISAVEVAQKAGTIAWHVFTGITARVEREESVMSYRLWVMS